MCVKIWVLTVWILILVDITFSEKYNGELSETAIYIHDGEEIQSDINPSRGTYNKKVNKLWVLQEEMGVWALIFHALSIEDSPRCRHDYLEIREIYDRNNQSNNSDQLFERYCGIDLPSPYISQRPHVEVRFVTDNLWEMEGFHIKVIHALSSEILQEKMRKYAGGKPRTFVIGSHDQQDDAGNHSKEERTLFYILVVSAVAAFVIFGTLLTYFITTMRKINNREKRESEVYFIPRKQSCSSKNRNHLVTKESKKKPFIDIENSGKRYTRGKLSNISPSVCQTDKLLMKDSGMLSHHNNLYVANFKFSTN